MDDDIPTVSYIKNNKQTSVKKKSTIFTQLSTSPN